MHQTNPVATGCKAKCPQKMDKEGSKNRDVRVYGPAAMAGGKVNALLSFKSKRSARCL